MLVLPGGVSPVDRSNPAAGFTIVGRRTPLAFPRSVTSPFRSTRLATRLGPTHLLKQGFTLKQIGDHLGHRQPETTRLYAKVDLHGLRQVADFSLGDLL